MPYSALWGIFLFYNNPKNGPLVAYFTPILLLKSSSLVRLELKRKDF